ncbi:MAG: hypothetical protein GXX96_16890 [Planctomycetaceae bacterium]|jgi:hypothetical protein|nr:hypothetical protein [Planctomycetaceae bacterium]
MEPDGTSTTPPPRFLFYCRDCDMVFEAAPDGTGYEQTPCPACQQMCLTVEFEQEEMQRDEAEASFASFLGGLLINGLPRLGRAERRAWHSLVPRRKAKLVTIAHYETCEDAEADVKILAEHGIRALTVGEETRVVSEGRLGWQPTIELQVPVQFAFTAGQILRAADPPQEEQRVERDMSEEDVVFPCEECGEMLSFPGYRRGKVEVCRHCGEYVDVPSAEGA